ncbi:hypothetical protein AKJ09_00596 [Labilithrix luteola]|uniref:Type IV fimbrial biogenesis protein PilY1 n=1 Tax=Labilithrix luteola TaxID=1391654 RepID=A0A0K1PK88_9BACT|nr:hypothetical protein [Labilithrix luteola]AKU93932.1 hypothetical protein AKJ09_00596 [Labilithrix luteola]
MIHSTVDMLFHKKNALRAGALGVGLLLPIFASCASEGDERTVTAQDASVIPGPETGDPDADTTDADSADGGEADGGCDAADPNCTTHVLSCDEADWCPATTGIDGRVGFAGIWGSGKNDVWAVGSNGTVGHYDGTSWTALSTGVKQSLFGVWGSSATDVWITSTPGATFHSTGFANGTATFTAVAPPIADYATVSGSRGKLVTAVWGSSSSDVWFAGENFTRTSALAQESQWRTAIVDGGAGFQAISGCIKGSTCPAIRGLWGSSENDVWGVGPDGYTRHTDGTLADGGVPTWTVFDSLSNADLLSVWGANAGSVWTVGNIGTIRHFVTGATTWAEVASPTTNNLRAIWGTSDKDIWAVGEFGTVIHYDGTEWKASTVVLPEGTKPHLNGVWGSGTNDVWVVGDGIVLHFTGHKAGAQGDGQ